MVFQKYKLNIKGYIESSIITMHRPFLQIIYADMINIIFQ